MVTKNRTKIPPAFDPTWFTVVAVVLISLYINPSLADPFNSPKLWTLIVLGAWALGYCLVFIRYQRQNINREQKIGIYLLLGFLTALLAAALTTELSFNAFFGEQQRRLGFLFYAFMAIFMLTSLLFFTTTNIARLYKGSIFLGMLLSIYGFMQYFDADFISWSNPYNSIILTLGNPNFASALMAILAILIFTFALISKYFLRFLLILLGLALLILITLSNSRQGLISFGIGMSVVVIILVYQKNKKLGLFLSFSAIPISILVVLAMLQIGPLVQYIYKTSVSIRGFYWRAGIEMFKSNVITGVGVDSYGDYFKLLREKEYPLRFGFQITSDNAHNVPIQIFATSGVFTGLAYLCITVFIFLCGVEAIKQNKGKNKVAVVGIFGAWISFQAQSIISIDNLGLTIWGWILGGALIGLCKNQGIDNSKNRIQSPGVKYSNSMVLEQKILSAALTLVAIIGSSVLYQGEKLMAEITGRMTPGSTAQSTEFYRALSKFDNAKLVEPAYRFRASSILFQIGEVEKAEERIAKLLKVNPKSPDYLNACVEINLRKSELESLIICSEKLALVDPYNAQNYLLLAKAYALNGKVEKAASTYKLILTFAKSTPQGEEAEDAIRKLLLK